MKIRIGDWLESLGCRIFDERENKDRPRWGIFELKNTQRHPDLVIQGYIERKGNCFLALEIKPGYKHINLLNGFDEVL